MSNSSFPPNSNENQQAFLFFQGPPSGFAKQVGQELEDSGFRVFRINFCLGDWIYWRGRNSISFRGRSDEWPSFVEEFIRRENITDIVYFADRLPYHREAASVARRMGVREISYEFGYLRPDWIVLERGGQSSYSYFPNTLEEIRKISKGMKQPDFVPRYSFSFFVEAFNEVIFNLANYFGWFVYPHYDADRYFNPLLEYFSYIRRFSLSAFNKKSAVKIQEQLISTKTPYFIVPLQMQNDYQIRANSGEPLLSSTIQRVVQSFASGAAKDAHLVFKVHPLDNGMENWKRIISNLEMKFSLSGRLHYLDGGDLLRLTRHAKGMVTVNSTSGIHALQVGAPVKVLGVSVYDIDGITHQGDLASFWTNPYKPKAKDVNLLVKVLANTVHVKGDFYSRQGRAAASKAMSERLTGNLVNSNNAFVSPPPRLEKARAVGIEVEYP